MKAKGNVYPGSLDLLMANTDFSQIYFYHFDRCPQPWVTNGVTGGHPLCCHLVICKKRKRGGEEEEKKEREKEKKGIK